ncbi:MAG: hypothetical protein RUDDFDWM_001690 [Candidatus Fervidibacterota bacterium]
MGDDEGWNTELDEVTSKLCEVSELFLPWLVLHDESILALSEDELKGLLREPAWGGLIIKSDGSEQSLKRIAPSLKLIKSIPDSPKVHISLPIDVFASLFGEEIWQHERYTVSAHEDWQSLLPKEGYAFALSISNPSHCITLCTPDANLSAHITLPTGKHELHIWRKRGCEATTESCSSTHERVERLRCFLSPLSGIIDGIIVDCSTMFVFKRMMGRRIPLRCFFGSAFTGALNIATSECGLSEVQVLRSVCYDPSLDANRTRLIFWRGIASSYATSLIEPMAQVASEMGLNFGLDWSCWRNQLSPILLFGDLRQMAKSVRTDIASSCGVKPILITTCNALGLRMFKALLGEHFTIAARASHDSDELSQAFVAAKSGAGVFITEIATEPNLPEWLCITAYLEANWWLKARKTLNKQISTLFAFASIGDAYSPAAVLMTMRYLLSKSCMTKVHNEAVQILSDWSDLNDLLERFHLCCDWLLDEDLENASVEKDLPMQVASVSLEHSGLKIKGRVYTTFLLPTPAGLSKAAWMKLSELHDAGGSIFLVGPPPSPSEIIPETVFLKWVQASARSYEVRFTYAKEFDMPLDDLSPVTYQNPHGGCLGMFNWRICPDKVEAPLMVHRMLTLSIRPMAETHHPSIRTLVRWVNETPIVAVWNDSEELSEFALRVRCIGRAFIWQMESSGGAQPYLHYDTVEDELDAYGMMCMVLSLALPPRHWCAIAFPPGTETHVMASNFTVTDVKVAGTNVNIRGFARKRYLRASVCVGRRVIEFEADEPSIPEDERDLDRLVRATSQQANIIVVGKVSFSEWAGSYRFPWSLIHHKSLWHQMSGERGSLLISHAERFKELKVRARIERPPNCKRFLVRICEMPSEWFTINLDDKVVAVNARFSSELLQRLSGGESCELISGCDTHWLELTELVGDGTHHLLLSLPPPEGGQVSLPRAYVLMELLTEDVGLVESLESSIAMSGCYEHLRVMRGFRCNLSVQIPKSIDELQLTLASQLVGAGLLIYADSETVATSLGRVKMQLKSDGTPEKHLRVYVGEMELGNACANVKVPLNWTVAFGVNVTSEVSPHRAA